VAVQIFNYVPQQQFLTDLQGKDRKLYNFLVYIDNYLTTLNVPTQNVFTLNSFITAAGTVSYQNPVLGQALIVTIQQDGIGHTTVWGSNFINATTINTTPGSYTVALFIGLANNTWLLVSSNIVSLNESFSTPTPTIVFGTPGVAPTYGTQTCQLERIGKKVLLTVNIVLTNKGTGTGAIAINLSSIPTVLLGATCATYILNGLLLTTPVMGLLPAGSSVIGLFQTGATGSVALADTNLSNTFTIILSLEYQST
jgi:hypothetical protein